MENNEQLNQNIQNQNVENELKNAIDGNEKEKIVKLIQSSILPGQLEVKVSTLVEQPAQEEELPALEMTETEEDEAALEVDFNLEGLTKEQLVEMLEETVKELDLTKI